MKIPNVSDGHVAHRDRWSLSRHRTASPSAARCAPSSSASREPFAAPANTRILAITCCRIFFEPKASLHQRGADRAGRPEAMRPTWRHAASRHRMDDRAGFFVTML
ncbi:hypothetical protein [Burkholderia territorii]|uniref:hypothetical protein n=1 Tax=Burkholderia territorii TaxID=1503055 RepID=UPI000B13FE23|nr:hypothetical protein [Burkholderia territorii]